MNFFKSMQAKQQPSSDDHEEEDPLHNNIFSNVQTHFTNFIRSHNPFPSTRRRQSPLVARIDNQFLNHLTKAVNNADIKKSYRPIELKLNYVPVYRLMGSLEQHTPLMSEGDGGRGAVFYFFSKRDAEALLRTVKYEKANREFGIQLTNVPLSEIIKVEQIAGTVRPDIISTRLVPDMNEVKNALKEREKAGIHGESFSGVPVFQSDALRVMVNEWPDHYRRAAFFKKADLEKALRKVKELDQTDRAREIQVTALEDIIQEMKDCSKSMWNDVIFIPPGN